MNISKQEVDKRIDILKKLCIASITLWSISFFFIIVLAGLVFSTISTLYIDLSIAGAITGIAALCGILWIATGGVWLAAGIMAIVNSDEIISIYPNLKTSTLGWLIIFFSLIPTCILLAKLKKANLYLNENAAAMNQNQTQYSQVNIQPNNVYANQYPTMQQPQMYSQPQPQPQQVQNNGSFNISQELEQLKFLKDNNEITQEQYDKLKAKIIEKIA